MKAIQPTLFSFAAFAILLFGCNPNAKLAQKCAEQFPCKDSLAVREVTLTDTVELTDTYVQYLDTTVCPPSTNGVTIIDTDTVRVPGQKIVITRTVLDSTWWRLDQAALAAMQQDLDDADKAIAEALMQKAVLEAKIDAKKKHICWLWVAVIVLSAAFLLLFWRRLRQRLS